MTTSEQSMRMRLAAHKSWSTTTDRSARTEAARRASHHTRFLNKARELHPQATDAQIEAAASSLRKAHYTELALKSAQSRRIKSERAKEEKRIRQRDEIARLKDGIAAA
ncbi:hypothetical protein ACPCUK_27825 [Streptomyces arboris]|uniref:hypothetical protein n=1 Tax=Streptomyces arboris TaxID=2600619 RepID=UPI003C2E4646